MVNPSKLRAVMAGSGNPYSVLNDLRKQIVRALHDQHTLADIQDMFQLSAAALLAEIEPLIAASLLQKQDHYFVPTFFVADADETQAVVEHARIMGAYLFEQLKADWAYLSDAYNQLTISQTIPFQDNAFLVVGANILDTGFLECLAEDRTLLPGAPHRPAPDSPDAHYYFWMIEGAPNHFGKYGQKTIGLAFEGWSFFTFGQYHIGPQYNEARGILEDEVLKTTQSASSAATLAAQTGLPVFNAYDIALWKPIVQQETRRLLSVYRDHEMMLRTVYKTLKPRARSSEQFAEFFCWYEHVAYAHAIDFLEAAGLVAIPDDRFAAAIWQDNNGTHFFA